MTLLFGEKFIFSPAVWQGLAGSSVRRLVGVKGRQRPWKRDFNRVSTILDTYRNNVILQKGFKPLILLVFLKFCVLTN